MRWGRVCKAHEDRNSNIRDICKTVLLCYDYASAALLVPQRSF